MHSLVVHKLCTPSILAVTTRKPANCPITADLVTYHHQLSTKCGYCTLLSRYAMAVGHMISNRHINVGIKHNNTVVLIKTRSTL